MKLEPFFARPASSYKNTTHGQNAPPLDILHIFHFPETIRKVSKFSGKSSKRNRKKTNPSVGGSASPSFNLNHIHLSAWETEFMLKIVVFPEA